MTLEALFLTLLNRSIAATWIVLALLLLRPLMRKVSHTLCCAMWCLVAFRLICPFSIQSVLSLIPNTEPIPIDLAMISSTVINGGTSSTVSNTADPIASSMQTFIHLSAGMWLLGVALFALYALFSYLQLRRRVSNAVRQEEGVWLSDWIKYPFVLGVFHPRVMVPFGTDECDMPYILAHERAHLARRDHWRKPLAFALLAVFWFQPILWVAYFLFCRDIEFACDERAIRSIGVELDKKKLYAKALLRGNASRVSILACPLAFGGLQVKKRVRSVLTYKRPTFSLIIAVVILCGVVSVCFLTDPIIVTAENNVIENGEVSSNEQGVEPPSSEQVMSPPSAEHGEGSLSEAIPECSSIGEYLSHWFIKDDNGGFIFVAQNTGTEDGSITISIELGQRGNFSEPVTIPIPAGLRVMYAIDESQGVIKGYSNVGMSYGDIVWINDEFALNE